MAYVTLVPRQTAAQATQQDIDTSGWNTVFIQADGLATTETAPIYVKIGPTGVYKAATDLSGNAIKLTASIPQIELDGGPTYAVTKDVTAAACGVYATYGFTTR